MHITSPVLVGVAFCALLAATPAWAQNEAALKSYFEGRRVTVRLDLPGTVDGVDVEIDPARGINYKDYRDDLKRYGTALSAGDTSTVTMIKLKGDLIEFQIGGGGYGTFGDDTSTSSGISLLDKSEREKRLEQLIKDEKDRDRRRDMQDELNYLRSRRERENRALRAESERIEEMKRERLAERRLHGGSRFNLRYKKVPANITPQDVVAALTEYVDFNATTRPTQFSAPRPPDLSELRKGMPFDEVEGIFGRASQNSDRREGGLTTTTGIWDLGEQRLTATFVENVLVRWTIASR
jgi:hypothetical protein